LVIFGVARAAPGSNGKGGIPAVLDDVAMLQSDVDSLTGDVKDLAEAVDGLIQSLATSPFDVTSSFCFDVGAGIKPEFKNSTRGRIEIEGGVGVDVYGNGIEIDLEPVNDSKFDLGLGASANAKFNICVSLGVLKFIDQQQGMTARSAADGALVDSVRAAQASIRDALPAFVDNFGIQPKNLPLAIDSLQAFDIDLSDPAALITEGPQRMKELAMVLPLPAAMRTRLNTSNSPFETITEKLGDPRAAICGNLAALPPAVASRVSSICGDNSGTQLRNTINTMKSTVDDVKGFVEDIKNALPTKDNCKFFC
jgi:hypothetical protein